MKHDVNEQGGQEAETIALQALTFILSEPRHLETFLAETGFTPAELAANAEAGHVLEAALNQMMANEAILLAFAANVGLSPEDVARAHHHLATGVGHQRPLTSM
jgi:hypothetical protein